MTEVEGSTVVVDLATGPAAELLSAEERNPLTRMIEAAPLAA
jgi:hypothetical protein